MATKVEKLIAEYGAAGELLDSLGAQMDFIIRDGYKAWVEPDDGSINIRADGWAMIPQERALLFAAWIVEMYSEEAPSE